MQETLQLMDATAEGRRSGEEHVWLPLETVK